jgi:hypothetical protein
MNSAATLDRVRQSAEGTENNFGSLGAIARYVNAKARTDRAA